MFILPKVVKEFGTQGVQVAYEEVKCNSSKVHTFVGMQLVYGRTPEGVHVIKADACRGND